MPRAVFAGFEVERVILVVAIQHNPNIRDLYERRLNRGKAKMAALGAAMRRLLQIAFGVLKNQQQYREGA